MLSRITYRPGEQGAAEAHLGSRTMPHALSPRPPIFFPHFPASLQGQETHYLESIQADHALAVRNVIVSENLLPLLRKH